MREFDYLEDENKYPVESSPCMAFKLGTTAQLEDEQELFREIKNSTQRLVPARTPIQEPKSEYTKILSRSKVFKNDAEKINYLIKELENGTVKMKMLEMNIKTVSYTHLTLPTICSV
eukprot:TRINITY_DN12244_c0_g1_i1.p1 TRINITY_DN12244_c0_g1~~TRINITY_DN12244_c0_g1_i1.p1  ORF type:complete len:117 (-),score=28.16 TRINITY_DN12244_c0_g1_i1:34-384(-)